MSAIYCISYNNYFNRTVKREESLAAYLGENNENVRYTEANFNFNPNDGANAVITVGRSENSANSYGDYLLVVENGEISSRWFILDEERLRGKQYRLNLRRDIVADYYEKVLNSTAFIEKGLPKYGSSLIFNSEGISFNQIKKNEIELKDDSKMAWIIGFIDRETESKTLTLYSEIVPDYEMSTYRFKDYFLKDANSVTLLDGYVYVTNTQYSSSPVAYRFVLDEYANQTYLGNSTSKGDYKYTEQKGTLKAYIQNNGLNLAVNISSKHSLYDGISSDGNYNSLLNEKDKIVRDGTKYYKIGVKVETHEQTYRITEDKEGTYLLTYLTNFMRSFIGYKSGTPYFEIYIKYYSLRLTKTEVSQGEYTVSIPLKTNRLINKNAPFDLFCIPFSDDMKVKVGTFEFQANKEFAMSIGSEIARTLGASCYHVQLLPYCPITGFLIEDSGGTFNINSTDTKRTTYVKNANGDSVYAFFWSSSSSGSKNILTEDGSAFVTVNNEKIENECDFYRLVSPNYNGQFEFSAAKNGGVKFFNVDYTYLPYSSYIHVNPDFGGLYGKDFNDARGLICQGDFSIMYLSDAWINYQIQNKNYNNIFDREIQNMDTLRSIEKKQQRIAGAINAAVTGSAVAAAGKNILGGGAIGAGVGTAAASLMANEADIYFGDKIYQENKSYRKDIFEYSLDNVKAIPNSIAKTTAYTENNKIFPVLEYYSCTDEEKNILANEIAQKGMTIESIDYLISYATNTWEYNGIVARNFIKAQLIKTDIEDNHIADVLSTELAKGLYFEV